MAKGTKLSEFAKGTITALKKSENLREKFRNFSLKTVICNYLKSPNKYGTRKSTGRPEKISPQFKRTIVYEEIRKLKKDIKKIEISCGCSLQY